MKTSIRVTLTLVALASGSAKLAHATEVGNGRNFGLGFQIGDPTAIIGKVFVGNANAIDFGLGLYNYGRDHCFDSKGRGYFCNNGDRHLSLHADFLWQDNLARGSAKLDWHIGAGGRVHFWRNGFYDRTDLGLAARMPLGLDLTFEKPSFLELFFELAPGIWVYPNIDIDVDAAVGVRFYF
jgi:hypothetical protein